MNWIPPANVRSSCNIETMWFPFDDQKCYLKVCYIVFSIHQMFNLYELVIMKPQTKFPLHDFDCIPSKQAFWHTNLEHLCISDNECTLIIQYGSWTYNGWKLDLRILDNGLDTSEYVESGEWVLIGFVFVNICLTLTWVILVFLYRHTSCTWWKILRLLSGTISIHRILVTYQT